MKPTDDYRPPWEIEYCMRYNFTASFLKEYNAQGDKKSTLQTIYGTADLQGWARKRIVSGLAKCEEIRAGRELSAVAQDTVAGAKERLVAAGFVGDGDLMKGKKNEHRHCL